MVFAGEPHLVAASAEGPRPFYLIKHCTNSVRRLAKVNEEGANAVELDIQFRHQRLSIGHPFPNPPACWFHHANGDDVPAYFQALAGHLRGGVAPLELVFLDIKAPGTDTEAYGAALAAALLAADVPPNRVVLSVPVGDAAAFVRAVRAAGFDAAHVDAWFDAGNGELPTDWLDVSVAAGSCFLGVGADPIVFWRPTPTWGGALQAMIDRRAAGGPLHHVYFWTLARRSSLRFALDLGVDGAIVNRPRRFLPVFGDYQGRYALAGAVSE